MQGQFQSSMSLFTSDADRIYLRVPLTGMYEPGRTAVVWVGPGELADVSRRAHAGVFS